jgi:YbbR domain-containing protein
MTKKTSLIHFALGVSFLLGMTGTVLAQSTNGSIRGTVLDPSGALVPRAQVTVSNASGFSRTLKSDATGNFDVAHLAPGSYSVSIQANGFTPALEGGVQVAGDKITREKIKLGISVNQEIEVSANDNDPVSF